MNEFKSIGIVAQNTLNKIMSDYINKICNRHIAMLLSDIDEVDDVIKENIKSHFKYFASDIKTQVLGIGDNENDDTK